MEINIYSIAIWITALLTGSMAITIYLGSSKKSSTSFAFGVAWTTIWMIAVGFFISSTSYVSALFLVRLTYFLALIAPISFLYFFYTFPYDVAPPKLFPFILAGLSVVFFFIFIFTDLIIIDPFPLLSAPGWGWHFGSFSYLFELSFFGLFLYGIGILYRKYRDTSKPDIKQHLKYIIWIFMIGSIPPSLAGIIIPRFGYFDLNWFGPVSEILWIPIIAYSITKHHLFNTKIIAIEVVTFGLWIIILIRTFLAQNIHEILVEVALLLVTITFSILLIRSVLHEISQREKIEGLAKDLKKAYGHLRELNEHLEQKVADQTKEVRAAYEVEKKARRELERLNEVKDQFITSTQHHLRTPLTALKWELESIRTSTDSTAGPELGEALKNADTSVKRLSHIIENFISITAEKEGSGNVRA